MAIQITRELPEIITTHVAVNAGGNSIYSNFTIDLPNDLIGKTITAVKLEATWSATQPAVSGKNPDNEHYLSFKSALDPNYKANSEDILAKFQSGETSIKLYCIFKNSGSRNRQFWWNVKVSITYESNDLQGFFTGTIDSPAGKYTLSRYSLAENEIVSFQILLDDPSLTVIAVNFGIMNTNNDKFYQPCTNLIVDEYNITTGTFSFNRNDDILSSSSNITSTENNIYYNLNDNSEALLQFFVNSSMDDYTISIKDLNNKPFKFCKSRLAPSITFSNLFSDTNYFPVVNNSQNNDIIFDVDLSSFDDTITLQPIRFTYNNDEYLLDDISSPFTITLPSIPPQNTTYPLTVIATDSFGATSSAEVVVKTCEYSAPNFNLTIGRISEDEFTSGIYNYDDDGTILGVNGTIIWQPTIQVIEGKSLSNILQLSVNKITTDDTRFVNGNVQFYITDLSSQSSPIEYSNNTSILTYEYEISDVTSETNEFSNNFNYKIELKLEDNFSSYIQEFFINKSTPGYFNIEKTGVAVGRRNSYGTLNNPTFEVGYPMYITLNDILYEIVLSSSATSGEAGKITIITET